MISHGFEVVCLFEWNLKQKNGLMTNFEVYSEL